MENENLKKGIIFGILACILIGLQPIVGNSRPIVLDAFVFAAMTMIVEAIVFFPLMIFERNKIRDNYKNELIGSEELDSLLYGYKRNKLLLIFVGLAFGFGMFLFFLGYQLAGTINGSLAQKSSVLFLLLFGFLILHEKISKKQILFSILLFFGLILAVTQGSFNLLTFNIGVLIIILLVCIWTITHTISKPMLDRKEATAIQMVCIRNAIGGLILISIYVLFFPKENLAIFSNPENYFWFILMGVVYGAGLFCWYKTLSNLEINKAAILTAPTPIVTAIFAAIFLGEIFTIYHLIGTSIILFSIIMIVREGE
ncbi:MAG: DMT family transporter [Promethearchaeota archaeon]